MFEGAPKDAISYCILADNFGNSSTRKLAAEAKSMFIFYTISLGLISPANAYVRKGMSIR